MMKLFENKNFGYRTPVFRSLLDLVFAVLVFALFLWNVTPANNKGRFCIDFFLSIFSYRGRYLVAAKQDTKQSLNEICAGLFIDGVSRQQPLFG